MVGVVVRTRGELFEDKLAEDALSIEEPCMVDLSTGKVAIVVGDCSYHEQGTARKHANKRSADDLGLGLGQDS